MKVEEYWMCTVLIVSRDINLDNMTGKALRLLSDELKRFGFKVRMVATEEEADTFVSSDFSISCVLLAEKLPKFEQILDKIKYVNADVPIFILSLKLDVEKLPLSIIRKTKGYMSAEDTMAFLTGRVKESVDEYLNNMLPPFFKELVDYTYNYKYAWHTPGHMGGIAFRKAPCGRFFFDFFGENMFRADLSVSVPELGSMLYHVGVVNDAEVNAARIFGAERTYFVTNGTSTANKIVFHGCVTEGDVVLVDRNCHKSAMHAIIMTGAIPVYFIPVRNDYGIIGPIHNTEFDPATVKKKIKACTLLKGKKPEKARLSIVTNSTYDGLCYNVHSIKKKLWNHVENMHFDEAWYGYAKFHQIYAQRYAMYSGKEEGKGPMMFATQSTHKIMAALSQGSMVHVKSGSVKLDHDRFNEAYMMHGSTSPQYEILASLDVGAQMMDGQSGVRLMDESISEAIEFRKKMILIQKQAKKGWWFGVWQPTTIKGKPFDKVKDEVLRTDTSCWTLKPDEQWHGFGKLENDHILLDPIKVTITTPGIKKKGGMDSNGIPAGIVSTFLRTEGIVAEKTGHYSFLCLFTIGTTRGKSITLINALSKFKQLYDRNALFSEVFPAFAAAYPKQYNGVHIKEFCDQMHTYLRKADVTGMMKEVYAKLPEQATTPAAAYQKMVRGNVKKLTLEKLQGKVSAAMIVPYPPGIPIIMPGERFTASTKAIVDYLRLCEDFDNAFPGFENEIHGVTIEDDGKRKRYVAYCVC